jgi:hypothetical protein
MFSFFRKKKSRAPDPRSPKTLPVRMSLDERMAYRREMLYQGIRESMLSLEVISSMYKFKVMNIDVRQHRFIIMIDVTSVFTAKKNKRALTFLEMEMFLKKNIFERFGVILEGIYWRVTASEAAFNRKFRAGDSPQTDVHRIAANRRNELAVDAKLASQRLARTAYEPISEAEKQALMEAIKKGAKLPVLHVGDREYKSDLAPLDDGIMIGGTHYGSLE